MFKLPKSLSAYTIIQLHVALACSIAFVLYNLFSVNSVDELYVGAFALQAVVVWLIGFATGGLTFQPKEEKCQEQATST